MSLGSKDPYHALIFFGNLTRITVEKFHDYLDQQKTLYRKRKKLVDGNLKGQRTKFLYIKQLSGTVKRKKANLDMTWIDFKGAYDVVAHK